MAYTTKITNKTVDKESQMTVLDVEFTKGETVFTKQLRVALSDTMDDIKRKIKGYITQLEAGQTNADTITVGDLDLSAVDLSKPQAEVDKSEWFMNWEKLQLAKILVDHGVFPETNKKYTDLQAKVKTDFKPEYIDLV